tara:strand:+ start:708 stop:914 length:207 start_codon:yes stop_codon:yes gene_type:complete
LSEEINKFYFMALLDIVGGTTKGEMQTMLQFYEELEMYEACAGILKAIKEHEYDTKGIKKNNKTRNRN